MTVIDYDAPRRTSADEPTSSLEELRGRPEVKVADIDVDESELAELFELPGADLSGEELTVRVVPQQRDEFVCSSCFLVHHLHMLASERNGVRLCSECAA
jgi:hypothetical protein